MGNRKSIFIKNIEIKNRVEELGAKISERLRESDISKIVAVWLADGAIFFASDLIRRIDCQDIEICSLRVSSYGDKLESNGVPQIFCNNLSFNGETILLIDDIFDTGKTAESVLSYLKEVGVGEIITCFLFDKKVPKVTSVRPDFVGFEIENSYIFGYGLDAAGKYRNLPDVWKFDE